MFPFSFSHIPVLFPIPCFRNKQKGVKHIAHFKVLLSYKFLFQLLRKTAAIIWTLKPSHSWAAGVSPLDHHYLSFVSYVCWKCLSNDPGKVDSNFFCYATTVLSQHRNVLIFEQRIHKPAWRLPRNKMHLHSTLKGCFFVLKDFNQSQELKTIAKKRFLCYSNWDQILLNGRWLESKDEYMYGFMKFC